MDDFFADLLPTKPSDDASKAGNSTASFQDDAVLPSKLESPSSKSTLSQSSLDLVSGDSHKSQPSAQMPMGETKMRKELREYQQVMQAVVDGAFKRFSGDLQRVLEEISQ